MSDIRSRQSSGLGTTSGNRKSHEDNLVKENSSSMDNLSQRIIEMNDDKEKLLNGDSPGENEEKDVGNSNIHVVHVFGRSINIVVAITHFNIFLYAACFWIQNAVFPYLSKQMGANPVTFGYLQTTFAIVQLAGGPLFGRFGDLFGSRLAMMLAFAACSLSYFLLYMASSISILFLSRLPSIFMHAMQGGQMIVTDVVDPKDRANALGKLGLSYGLGMVGGTLAGGLIAKLFSLETAAMIACFGSLFSIAIIYLYVPPRVRKTKYAADSSSQDSIFSLTKILQIFKAPGAAFLMAIKLGTGIPIGIFQSMFSIIALETFQLAADKNSYMMTYIGVLSMLVQGFAVGIFTRRFSDLAILTGSAMLLCFSYFSLSFVTSIYQLCVVFLPMVTGLTFQTVITTSALTNTVSSADTGAVLGMSMAVNSFIRSLAPTIGGYMMASYGFPSFGYLGFITTAIVSLVLVLRLQRQET